MKKLLFLILISCIAFPSTGNNDTLKVYKFKLQDMIAPAAVRLVNKALDEATRIDADLILMEMNTYGGLVDAADSIRTRLLRHKIPVWVYIENNAASAGALIAIACDSIFMSPGSTIGAATVVDETGQQVPDKYQSYMRKKMRATAEITGRDPEIAEAMVDPDIVVEGVSEKGKVVTFSAEEALIHGFCEAIEPNWESVLKKRLTGYTVQEHVLTTTDKILAFLIHPMMSSLLIMLIIGGLYFELQTPGVGFPLAASVTAAILYFAPHYLEGLADHWEILLFLAGIGLLAVEIFAIPGFGVAGISGIVLILTGLILSLVDNVGFHFPDHAAGQVLEASGLVMVSFILAIGLSLYFGGRLLDSRAFSRVILASELGNPESFKMTGKDPAPGATGTAFTYLRPSGKIEIGGVLFEASSMHGYIEPGTPVKVVKREMNVYFVEPATPKI